MHCLVHLQYAVHCSAAAVGYVFDWMFVTLIVLPAINCIICDAAAGMTTYVISSRYAQQKREFCWLSQSGNIDTMFTI